MRYFLSILFLLPFIFLLWLANVADKRRMATPAKRKTGVLVYACLASLWVVVLAAAVFLLLMGAAYTRYADIPLLTQHYAEQGLDPQSTVRAMQSLPRLGAGLTILALLGMLTLLPSARRLISRIINISPDSIVHAVALSYTVLILVNFWLVAGMDLGVVAETFPTAPSGQMIVMIWFQNILMVVMALVGIGWLSRRDLRNVLHRLEATWPQWRDVGAGVGMGGALFLLYIAINFLFFVNGYRLNPNIQRMIERFSGPLMTSFPGVLTMGVAAALGEELVYRGALQPRFGVFLTALFFTLMHVQYGVSSATLMVFIVGLALGWMRQRRNTTTAIFTHATYNITMGLMFLLLRLVFGGG